MSYQNTSIADISYNTNENEDSLLGIKEGTAIAGQAESGLEFSFNSTNEIPSEASAGLEEAAANWSSLISDEAQIDIDIAFGELNGNALAEADSNTIEVSYEEYRQALTNDATSNDDAIALTNLPEGNSIDLLTNNTQENQGSDEPYLDNNGSENNSTISLTTANAKALGIDVEDNQADVTITFDSSVNWDFDRSDGIDPGATDFVGVATHEIGHALGFTSTTDGLDEVAGQNLKELISSGDVNLEDIIEALGLEDLVTQYGLEELVADVDLQELIAGSPIEPVLEEIQPDQFVSEDEYVPTSVDLFRYSNSSSELGAIDLTTGETEKYFSLDQGQTEIAQFSTGEFLGDGEQSSHWKDNLGIGIMDPTFDNGELGNITSQDLQLLDAIGWDTV
jgi:hypothetical protein